jgi:antitoxin component YwqK of YwqJK toxin-antitoxin module
MALKELLRNNFMGLTAFMCILATLSSCGKKQVKQPTALKDYFVDTTLISHDTVFSSDKKLSLVNGLYLYANNTFTGIVVEMYDNGVVKKQLSVYKGMLHGRYKSFFENGMPWEVRMYKNNLSTGTHIAFWPETGNQKFEYNYYEEKMEGSQKKWYPTGKPFLALHYTNDHEDGLQQGWRENGKLFLNYVAKDGFRYGLQKAALCYSLRDGKINSDTK